MDVIFMNKKMFIPLILSFVVIRVFIFLIIPHIEIRLNGEDEMRLEYGSDYKEKGAKVFSCNIFKCNFISEDVSISEIDVDSIGHYEVTYEYENGGISYYKHRYIDIVDTIKPELNLVGKETIYLSVGSKYVEFGASAAYNYDGDLTENIIVDSNVNITKAGTYFVYYSVKDKSKNESKVNRRVIVYGDEKKDVKDIKDEKVVAAIKEIDSYIKTRNLSISVIYNDIVNGYTYTYNPNKIYYGCSLIKALDAMYVYENMDVTDSLKAYVKKAIMVSDNDAHYKLVSTIGRSKLTQYGKNLVAKYVLTTSDIYGNTTVYDQLVYMRHLFQLINTLSNGDELKGFFLSDFKKYMDFEGAPDIMHKYGRISGVYFHDSAVFLDEKPYVISILTIEDNKKYIITELSKKIYKLHHLLNDEK